MNRLPTVLLGLLTVLSPLAVRAQSAPDGFKEQFLRQFEASSRKILSLAEAMPEEKYSWSPGEGVMPVAQVYMHIARYNYYYPQNSLGIPVPQGVDLESLENIREKTRVIDVFRQSVDHVRRAVEQMPAPTLEQQTRLYGRDVPGWAVLFQLLAHMNEHVGQSIAYARMNDVVPPWSR